jgi:small conductance mechanosensitive channel
MHIVNEIRNRLADGRLDANLLVFYGGIVVCIVVSLVLRRLLARGGSQLSRLSGFHWLHAVGEEAARRARQLLFWVTVVVVLTIGVGGTAFHLAGGDIRVWLKKFVGLLTVDDFIRLGLTSAYVVALVFVCRVGARLVRALRPRLERYAARDVRPAGGEEAVRRWFVLAERYAVTMIHLATAWAVGHVVCLGHLADTVVGLLSRLVTVLVLARLLTLASRALSHALAEVGNHYLGRGHLIRYWERVKRLFPFGERCFEAAVYVGATSLCVQELHFLTPVIALLTATPRNEVKVEVIGARIVACIGIVFGTRVLIELLQVLLNEAFGMYDEESTDQKGRTLVPLLLSVSQYVLYFGSGVAMLDVFHVNTGPILAGAGILGLGVGLGAQSLVTDVVSGFFILFEGQYFVGDYVQIGDATGTVEAVGIRVTQIRDGQGKLYIIPNGQIKAVVNYSKGYVNAVVDVRVPSGTDLEGLFRVMTEAGRRLRQARKEVLAETQIHGLVELGTSEMTVRAVTKVQPGTHVPMQNEYRRLLKQVFDQAQQRPAVAA